MAWSPDFGDYWATITPRYPVQDFVFESSTTLYVLNARAWSRGCPTPAPPGPPTCPATTHSCFSAIPSQPCLDGKVLVGGAVNAPYPGSLLARQGRHLQHIGRSYTRPWQRTRHLRRRLHQQPDSSTWPMMSTDRQPSAPFTAIPSRPIARWVDDDMMSPANGNAYVFAGPTADPLQWPTQSSDNPPHLVGQFGLVQAFTGDPQPALYSAHAEIDNSQSNATYRLSRQRSLPHTHTARRHAQAGHPVGLSRYVRTADPARRSFHTRADLTQSLRLLHPRHQHHPLCHRRRVAWADHWNGHWRLIRRRPLDHSTCYRQPLPGYTPTGQPGHALGIHRLPGQERPGTQEPG